MKKIFIALMLFIFTFGFGSPRAFAILEIQKSCKDFDTWEEAQAYFEANGGLPGLNIDDLDEDGDGIVCESREDYGGQTWEDLHPNEDMDEGTDEDNDGEIGAEPGEEPGEDIDEGTNEEEGGQLPETATNHMSGIIEGLSITVLGFLFFLRKKIMK